MNLVGKTSVATILAVVARHPYDDDYNNDDNFRGRYWSRGLDVGFWIQRPMVQNVVCISMLCPCTKHLICIASVDSIV